MTIRILQAWNGYPQQAVVSMSASEEARLVGLGIASFDLDGPAENVRMAQLATDAGGGAVGLVGLQARRSNVLSQKRVGCTVSLNSGLAYTYHLKGTCEAEFDAVQLVYYNHQTANAVAGFTAAVAATETAATDTATNLWQPVVGGSAVNTKDSTTDAYGWRTVTWSGASAAPSVSAAAAATPVPNVPACGVVPVVSVSDWIPLRSVPAADGSGLFYWMSRIYLNGVSNAYSFQADATRLPLMRTPTAANRGRILQVGAYVGDAIGTIGNQPATLGTTLPTVGLRFRCRKSGHTVMVVGDSITQADALVADKLSIWGARAAYDLSTPAVPVEFVNHGANSQNSTTFWLQGKLGLTTFAPSVAIYTAWSPNDNPFTDAGVTRYLTMHMLAKAHDFVAACRAAGVVPILTTGIPYGALSASIDAERQWLKSQVLAMEASGYCVVADTDGVISDGAVPARIKAAYDYGDGIHENEAAIEALAVGVIRDAIRRAI